MDPQPRVQRRDLPLLLRNAAPRAGPLLGAALLLSGAAAAVPGADGRAQQPAPEREDPHRTGDTTRSLPRTPPDTGIATTGRAELARRLERLLEDPALERAHVGLVVTVAETGEVLFERAAEKRFTAASTAKLVTAAAALERLGPGFRWTTRLVPNGPVEDGVLQGDLWVVGGGDPGLGPADLARWAGALRRSGVRRVAGDVVGDGRTLPPPRWGRGWMWDELHLGWAAGVTGLQLDRTGIRVWIEPAGEVGDRAVVRPADADAKPPDATPPVDLVVRTGPPGSRSRFTYLPGDRGPGSGRVEGWVPADADSIPLWLAPSHPTDQLLDAFGAVLRDSSVAVDGAFRRPREDEPGPREGEPAAVERSAGTGEPAPVERSAGAAAAAATTRGDPADVHTFRSDSLGAVLSDLLAPSDNQTAEMLLRTLGREAGSGPTAREGLEVVADVLPRWGIDPEAVALSDGSGLSRYDELTPTALVRLLRAVWRSPHHRVFSSALAAPGEEGTLETRLLTTPARQGLRAKTGSLSSVRALAGYVEAGDGRTLIFALLINGYAAPGPVVEGLRDLLVEQLSLHRRRVRPGWPALRGDGAGLDARP